MNGLDWALPLLVCPSCREPFALEVDGAEGDGVLSHPAGGCPERFPVIDGIPRLVRGGSRSELVARHAPWFAASISRRELRDRWVAAGGTANAVVRGFDYEWSRFRDVGTLDLKAIFAMYFDVVEGASFGTDRIVLDAGCGAGRWACEVAARGPRVLAVDLGASVELARASAGDDDRIACVQADLRELPVRAEAVDWAYSLGVLHHVEGAEQALARIVHAVKPGGEVLLYLYYALDQRGPLFRTLFRAVDAVRRLTSRAPRPVVYAVSLLVAGLVYWPLARLSRVLTGLGLERLASALPLSFYRDRSFAIMRNDSLDRFGTRLERRYSRAQMAALLESAGGEAISFSTRPPYWHAVARRSGRMTA